MSLIEDADLELLKAASAALLKRKESVMTLESNEKGWKGCPLDDGYTKDSHIQESQKPMAVRPLQPQGPLLSTDANGIIRMNSQVTICQEKQETKREQCVLIGKGFIKKHSMKQGLVETLQTCTPTVFSVPSSLLVDKTQKETETAGPGWFNMSAPEMTTEMKRDLHILKSRGVLDPKRHYKKDNSKGLPKFFQFGTIITEAADRYSSVANIPKKMKANTIVEELMADSEKKAYFKKKFTQIQDKKRVIAEASFRKTKGKLHKRRK